MEWFFLLLYLVLSLLQLIDWLVANVSVWGPVLVVLAILAALHRCGMFRAIARKADVMKMVPVLLMVTCAVFAAATPFAGWLFLTQYPPMDSTTVLVSLAALSVVYSISGFDILKDQRSKTLALISEWSSIDIEFRNSRLASYLSLRSAEFISCGFAAMSYLFVVVSYMDSAPFTVFYWAAIACCYAAFCAFAVFVASAAWLERTLRKDYEANTSPLFVG